MTQTLAVTSLDEAFINLARQAVVSVHFEIRVSGRLDEEQLRSALRQATAAHPLARARLASSTLAANKFTWTIADIADHLALEVTEEPVGAVRNRLESVQPDLSRSPIFLVALVRDSGGDYLIFNFHHAVFDGMGAVRFVTSVARAYSKSPDPIGGPAIEEARNLRAIAGSRKLTDLIPRVQKLAQDVLDRKRVTRLASDGGDPNAWGVWITTVRLTLEQTAAIAARKPKGATLNDVALAAQALTVIRWNEEHNRPMGHSVSIMMPVNIRPAEWSTEVVSNFASYLAIVIPASVSRDLSAATAWVREYTSTLKANGVAGWIVDFLEPGNKLPVIVKRALGGMLPLVQNQFVETTVLSNLGRITIPNFGDAGPVSEIWFSPVTFSEVMPIAVGVAGVGKELFVAFRGDARSLSAEAVNRYAQIYVETITNA